jgi:hypothetical protein
MNFTPGAVANVFCPAPGSSLAIKIAKLGKIARSLVTLLLRHGDCPASVALATLARANELVYEIDCELQKQLRMDCVSQPLRLA